MRTAIRTLMVAIALLSWLAISNHCAFAGIALRSQGPKNECPFHSKPAQPTTPPAGAQCCKTLRALTNTAAKFVARTIVDLPHVDVAFAQPIRPGPAKISFVGVFLDIGPPGTTSFVELIGSVQAHAPPSRA